MRNDDAIDLYQRVSLGTRVVVLPDREARAATRAVPARPRTASRSRAAIY